MEQKSIQQQKQVHKQGYYLSRQHLKLMHIMHLTGFALKEYLKNEIELNPALELVNDEVDDISDNEEETDKLNDEELWNVDNEWLENTPRFNQPDFFDSPVVSYETFREKLKEQIVMTELSPEIAELALYIIDELDDDGLLRMDLSDVADDFSFSRGRVMNEENMIHALRAVQRCDPAGVGARNVEECLLIQLKRHEIKNHSEEVYDAAEKIITFHFKDLPGNRFSSLKQLPGVDEEVFNSAAELISRLSPHPVIEANKYELFKDRIIPDFELSFDEDEITLSLTSAESVKIKVNDAFGNYSSPREKRTAKTEAFYHSLLEDANALIHALKEREISMFKVVNFMVHRQKEFFKTGDESRLIPMIQQDIVDVTGLDISTVSRIISNKYIQTPYGVFCLKNLFVRGAPNSNELNVNQTVLHVKEAIKQLIDNEDKTKPLSDMDLVRLLSEKNINIARRTVVKYRNVSGIPNSNTRKSR